MSKKTTVRIDSLSTHSKNLNKGTARGAAQLEHSIKNLGWGRSILVDKNGVAIAGNHVLQAAADAGLKDALVIDTDGSQLVVVRRNDLDLTRDKKAVELALADNRTSQVGFDMDVEQLGAEIADGLDVSAYFRDDELAELVKKTEADEQRAATEPEKYLVKLPVSKEEYEEFTENCKILIAHWSQERMDSTQCVLEAVRLRARTMGEKS